MAVYGGGLAEWYRVSSLESGGFEFEPEAR